MEDINQTHMHNEIILFMSTFKIYGIKYKYL